MTLLQRLNFRRRLATFGPVVYLIAFHVAVFGQDIPQLLADAQKGDLSAEINLAGAYENGNGTRRDYGQALRWYLKAAEQGNAGAMARVGYFYERGKGVTKDAEQALDWYKKASDLAESTHQQNFANGYILRLSRSGAIKEKYGGIPLEGALLLVKLDETTPLDALIQDLKAHPKEEETGKAYWIGYNKQMISVAARGDQAIPPLVELIKSTNDPEVRHAGLLTLHFIGIDGNVVGRFTEDFRDRAAREALWQLMTVEGQTDKIVELLKRDPWPADVPAIMAALAQVDGDCPLTLNALLRYPLPRDKRPIDTMSTTGLNGTTIRFTVPKSYTDRDYVRVAIEAIQAALPNQVDVEEGLLDQITADSTYGNTESKEWVGSLDELLAKIKELNPPFDYVSSGRRIYFFADGVPYDQDHPVILHFCSASTAKKRLLAWWQSTGRDWYCFRLK